MTSSPLVLIPCMSLVVCLNAYGTEQATHASYPIQAATTTLVMQSGLTKVDLPLDAIALLNRATYQVLDASGHIIPSTLITPIQPVQEQSIALHPYHWPAEAPTTREAAASLELQLSQDQTHAWVTWPERAKRDQAQPALDQSWLLELPDPEKYQQLSSRKIVLSWPSTALSIQATIEGSQDLINWTSVGSAALLDTGVRADQAAQLKQTSIAVDQSYHYWRLQLSAPLALSGAALVLQQPEQPVLQTQAVVFQQEGSSNRWTLNLPHAIATLGFKFVIPSNQAWSLTLSALQRPEHAAAYRSAQWQMVTQQSLTHWPTEQGATAANESLWINPYGSELSGRSVIAAAWQIKGLGPTAAQVQATLYGPSQSLYFVAQGQAPYHLDINALTPSGDSQASNEALSLPKDLTNLQQATLGTLQIIPPTTPWKTYGLWAVLIIAVGGLAIAAWRLLRGLDQQTG